MLEQELKNQLAGYLQRVQQPFEIVASLDDSDTSKQMLDLLQTIQGLRADKITLRTDGNDARKPSFSLTRAGSDMNLRFAGLPLGHEFTSLVLALLWTGGHPPKVEAETIAAIKALDGDYEFEMYMSLTCHNCPDVVQALNADGDPEPAHENDRDRRRRVPGRSRVAPGDGGADGVPERRALFGSGPHAIEEIVAKLDKGAGARRGRS
jgi:alkyl hydroperoxide reductase subunit F